MLSFMGIEREYLICEVSEKEQGTFQDVKGQTQIKGVLQISEENGITLTRSMQDSSPKDDDKPQKHIPDNQVFRIQNI
jgi:hypothetical protein